MSRRLPSKQTRETVAALEQAGWQLVRRCGSNHLQFKHRATGALLVIASTPSDRHAHLRALQGARRALRDWEAGRRWT